MSEDFAVELEGVLFSFSFYFVCPHGHVHPIEVKAAQIHPLKITEENLGKLRDELMKGPAKGMRMATRSEIDKHMMQEDFAASEEGKKVPGVLMTGPKEVQ